MNHNDNHSFYTSVKWRRKRESILRRDKYLCQICKKYGKNTEAVIVHHKVEVNDDWSKRLEDDNLISVCAKHHNQIHKSI